MSIKRFSFTQMFSKKFSDDMKKSQGEAQYMMQLGMERVARRRPGFFKFFMLLPAMGNMVFYKEGKKEYKERHGERIGRTAKSKKKKTR